jgi:hypothetical protein
MGSALFQPDMEAVLEWVLMLAVGASGLCMLGLATILIANRFRMYRQRKKPGAFWEAL